LAELIELAAAALELFVPQAVITNSRMSKTESIAVFFHFAPLSDSFTN